MPAFETDNVTRKHVWGARIAAALLFLISSAVLILAAIAEPSAELAAAIGGRLLLVYGAYYLLVKGIDAYVADSDQSAQPA